MRTKYGNKKVNYNGYSFASIAESQRYKELLLLQKAGEISGLKLQPRYILQHAFTHNYNKFAKIEYIADFEYIENGKTIAEDVKSPITAKDKVYVIKKKIFLREYGELYTFRENSYTEGKVVDY